MARGVQVKINSVLIPSINDTHIPEVNRIVREKGAILHNIMPLIARPEHGTHFGLTGQREPTAEELAAVRAACESDEGMMSHCQQCRADATGQLGTDRSGEFTMDKIEAMTVDPQAAMAKRAAVRAAIVHRLEQPPRSSAPPIRPPTIIPIRPQSTEGTLRIAVGSLDGQTLDAHFGHLRELLIYDVSTLESRLIEHREIARYCHGATTCGDSEAALAGAIHALHDCTALLCARVGFTPWRALEDAGIQPNSEHGGERIDDALRAIHREWRANGRLTAPPRAAQPASA